MSFLLSLMSSPLFLADVEVLLFKVRCVCFVLTEMRES